MSNSQGQSFFESLLIFFELNLYKRGNITYDKQISDINVVNPNICRKNCTSTIKCVLCVRTRPATKKITFKQTITSGSIKTKRTLRGKLNFPTSALCGTTFSGQSCANVPSVKVYPSGNIEHAIKIYAFIDEQSNRTLARSLLFDFFGI